MQLQARPSTSSSNISIMTTSWLTTMVTCYQFWCNLSFLNIKM